MMRRQGRPHKFRARCVQLNGGGLLLGHPIIHHKEFNESNHDEWYLFNSL